MSQTTPQIGLGTKVELAVQPTSGSPTYAIFGFVNNVNGPQEQNALVEVTYMQSTGKEFIYAVPDYGDFSVESHYAADHPTHSGSTGLLFMIRNRKTVLIRLTTPGATNSETFTTLVSKADRMIPVDGVMKLNPTFKITGPISTAPVGATSTPGGGPLNTADLSDPNNAYLVALAA